MGQALHLELRLLGRPEVLLDGRNLGAQIGAKSIGVLAFLALSPAFRAARDKLAGTFWSDKQDQAARYRLRHTLWDLRKALGEEAIRSDGGDCWLDRDSGICLDTWEFQQGCTSHGVGGHKYVPRPDQVDSLSALAQLYRGDLLENLIVPEAALFDEWLLVERERLCLLHEELLWCLARSRQAAGDHAGAIEVLARLIQIDPLRERNYRAQMASLFHKGERAAALQVYKQCAASLAAELGISPSRETERVRAMIVKGVDDPVDRQLKQASELCQRGDYAEAWALAAAVEALAADPITSSQVALLRAEIAVRQGKQAQSVTLLQAARKSLADLLK